MKERIRVYHKDGSLLNDIEGNAVELSAVEMTDGWMEDCFVQTTIESAYPINFSIGDYIVYRGERYELNYDPGKAKTARAGSDRGAFRYENVKLNALQDELVRAQFLDVVLGMENTEEQTIPYTALPKFGFYVQTVDDLLDRIQANMDEQMGAGLWALYSRNKERSLQRGCDGAVWEEMYGEGTTETIIDSAALTIDNQNCWNALALVNSKWDINFVVRGRNVFVDTTGLEVPYEFVYGKRRGLYEITQTADDSQAVTTRMRAYGSEKNLPTHYYANLCVDVFGETSKISHLASSTNTVLHITIPSLSWAAAGSYFTSVRDGSTAESREYNVTVKAGDIEGRGYAVSSARKEGEGTVTIILNSSNDEYGMTVKNVEDFYTAVMKERKVYFLQGVNKQSFPSKNMIANTDQMPSHMAVTRLMLPGFPKMSVKEWWDTQATEEEKAWINPSGKEHLLSELKNRPYVDSVNIKELGVRNGSVMFDTENKKEGIIEIYPTIEEMTVDGQRIDEINSGSDIKDNGIFKDGQTVPPFSVTLSPKVNFDINMLKKEDFTISMKDGKCGGREFKVNGSVKENGVWKLTLDRVKDDALELYFPNKDFQIESGDHFVLTGIEMPDSYVEAASAKLLKYALAWLDKNDYTRYVFEPKVDEIFMAYQHDKAKADTTGKTASLYETLKAGSLLHFSDTDLKLDKSGVIERLIIREELGSIPTYDVIIKEDKDVGALQKMQDAIDTVTMSVKSGLSSAQIEGLIRSRGAKYFISKTDPDTVQDVIRFLRGLTIGRTEDGYGVTGEGAATLSSCVVESVRNAEATDEDRTIVGGKGFDLYMGKDGKSHLYIDYLTARTKFFAASAEVRKVSYSGGTTLFSNAGSMIVKVAHVLDDAGVTVGYKCYAAADDGTTRTANWWHVGMMALCQTFNVKAGESENLANRYYWRLVVGVGQETLEDGKLYDYVILSNKRTFMGSEACVPVTSQKVIGADGKALVFGDVMIQVTTTGEKQSLAAVFEEQEGKTTDDGNNVIANRMFFGYEPAEDGGEPDVPQPYDVIVQAGDQIQWNRFGNLIKLTTSTEDGSDNGNAPALSMYHAMGAPYKTGDTVNPYQWKTLTSLDSPLLVLKNAKNFKFFTDDDPENIIDPVTVTYDLVPSSEYIIRKPNSQTATPNDITFTLTKRTGNVSETMKEGYLLTADYTTTDGASKSGVAINSLSDIGVSFYLLASVTVRATVKADNTVISHVLPVLSDGDKGDRGDDGTNGKDAVEFIVSNAPLVFDTDENGVVSASVSKTATIQVMRSGKNITSEVSNLFPSNSNMGCGKPTLTKRTDGIDVTISGASINKDSKLGVSVTSGYVIAYMAIGSTLYSQQIPFLVNLAKFTGTISADNKKLRTDYTELTNRVGAVETDVDGIPIKTQGELTKYTSTIEQTAREISLKVTQETVNMARNCIVGSALREYDEITPINGTEKVTIMSQGVGGTNYAQCYCSGATTNSWTGLYFKDVRVKPQTKYTFSVWMRLTVKPDNGCYVAIKTYNNFKEGTEVARITFPDSQTLNAWTLYQVAVSVPSGCTRLMIEAAVRQNGGMDICRPMMEEGETYQGWSLSPYDVTIDDAVMATGIDIKNGIIKATADTFEVNDNSGNVTARITEDGFFAGSVYATNGYFDGLVRNRKRVITKENFYEYFEKDTYSGMSDAYNPIWEKIGSNFVIQSTPEDADGAAMFLLLMLPTAYPITHPYTDGRYERAREVIGNTIIIRCENGNGITLYGTSRTAPDWDSGGVSGLHYTLRSGYVAYLTCKLKNTGSSSEESGYETIYWERVVRKALP